MCLCVPVHAGMVGGSHVKNDVNITGRARANVVYTHSEIMTATKESVQSVTADSNEVKTETETVPEYVPEIVTTDATDYELEIAMATEYIAQLKAEINQIDSEMMRCRRAKTNWTIGTVIGGAGVVGTATGAIIQSVQINKAKKNSATEPKNNSANQSEESK